MLKVHCGMKSADGIIRVLPPVMENKKKWAARLRG